MIDVPCPHCGERNIETVRNAWFVQGFLIFARWGSRSHVGCASCTRSKVLGSMALSGVIGWWCVPWGLGTPLVLAQNAVSAMSGPDRPALAAFLAKQGMDIDEMEIDPSGRARGQTRLLDAVVGVLHRMVWADGDADPREIAVGTRVASKMLGELADADAVSAALGAPEPPAHDVGALPDDARLIVLRAAAAVASADEVIDPGEVAMLRQIGQELGLSDALVGSVVDALQADTEARKELDALKAVAAEILGVEPGASAAEIQARYRAQLLVAVGDDHDPEAAAEQSERVSWAYHTLIG